MKLEDFEKQLLIEPGSEDESFLAARRASVEHMAAARESDQFEAALEQALKVETDANLAAEIIGNVWQHESIPSSARWGGWLAAAASVTLALGLGLFVYNGILEAKPIREAFVDHMSNRYEYPKILDRTEVVDEAEVVRMFGEFGADLHGDFGRVTYLTRCKIGGTVGIHLVVTEDSGNKTTVMYLPDEKLMAEAKFDVDQVTARMVSTPTGVAALFGHQGQDLTATTAALVQGLGGFGRASLAIN